MTLYGIARWNDIYEDYRTRRVKILSGVLLPNRFDAEGYGRIMAHPQGAVIFTAWIHLLQVASRCNPRGKLIRSNKTPHTPETLALKCKCPAEWFHVCFDFLKDETDWLTVEGEQPVNNPRPEPTTLPLRYAVDGPASGELPKFEDVVKWLEMEGHREESAKDIANRFWNHYESTGWIDRNGNRITNARSKLRSWLVSDRQTSPNGQIPSKAPPSEMILRSKELERVEEAIRGMKNNRPERPAASDADLADYRERWNGLVRRKKELMQFLGFTC